MVRFVLLLAVLLGPAAGLFTILWERTGPDSDPNGKPTGNGISPANPVTPVWEATGPTADPNGKPTGQGAGPAGDTGGT
jgi:hypothetical protein